MRNTIGSEEEIMTNLVQQLNSSSTKDVLSACNVITDGISDDNNPNTNTNTNTNTAPDNHNNDDDCSYDFYYSPSSTKNRVSFLSQNVVFHLTTAICKHADNNQVFTEGMTVLKELIKDNQYGEHGLSFYKQGCDISLLHLCVDSQEKATVILPMFTGENAIRTACQVLQRFSDDPSVVLMAVNAIHGAHGNDSSLYKLVPADLMYELAEKHITRREIVINCLGIVPFICNDTDRMLRITAKVVENGIEANLLPQIPLTEENMQKMIDLGIAKHVFKNFSAHYHNQIIMQMAKKLGKKRVEQISSTALQDVFAALKSSPWFDEEKESVMKLLIDKDNAAADYVNALISALLCTDIQYYQEDRFQRLTAFLTLMINKNGLVELKQGVHTGLLRGWIQGGVHRVDDHNDSPRYKTRQFDAPPKAYMHNGNSLLHFFAMTDRLITYVKLFDVKFDQTDMEYFLTDGSFMEALQDSLRRADLFEAGLKAILAMTEVQEWKQYLSSKQELDSFLKNNVDKYPNTKDLIRKIENKLKTAPTMFTNIPNAK
jgi:hypothetical protein